MHMTTAGHATLITWLPVIVSGLVLFAMAKWGKAKPWQLLVAVVAGIALSGTFIGPYIHSILSQLTGGWLH